MEGAFLTAPVLASGTRWRFVSGKRLQLLLKHDVIMYTYWTIKSDVFSTFLRTFFHRWLLWMCGWILRGGQLCFCIFAQLAVLQVVHLARHMVCHVVHSYADDPSIIRLDFPWAKPLSRLWKFNKWDFEAVKRYNLKMSQRKPFCAVCSILNLPELQVFFFYHRQIIVHLSLNAWSIK